MPLARKNAIRLLAIAGVALVALVIAILVGLRDRSGGEQQRFKAAPPAEATTAPTAERPATAPRQLAPGRRAPLQSVAPRTTAPAPRGTIRRPAPSALPAAISREKDPQRRAELLRMHQLATARVRTSLLRRRQALLENTIAKAREEGGAADRVRQLEGEMAELRIALRRAEGDLSRANAAVKAATK